MKIYINIETGNRFADGSMEVGKVIEADVVSRVDLEDVLDSIGDVDFFITDDEGTEFSAYEIIEFLD